MGRFQYCVRCGEERRDVEATLIVDGDPLCAMHARIAAVVDAVAARAVENPVQHGRILLPGAVCSRGCGNAPHRGLCAKASSARRGSELPEPAPISESLDDLVLKDRRAGEMDTLVCVEIPASEVPSGRERHIGRLGELWLRLMATDFEKALKVKCRDADHAGATARHMTLKARKAGVEIISRKVGTEYFCQRVKPGAKK